MDDTAQEGARGQDNRAPRNGRAIGQNDTGNPAVRDRQVRNLAFDHCQARQIKQNVLHCGPIQFSVRLRARTLHRRAFAPVQQAELYARPIRSAAHQPVHRVDLAHQMALAKPSDGRVARHHANAIAPQRDKRRRAAHARGRMRGLCPRMTAADHDDVEMFHVKQASLADAEARKDHIEQVLHIHPTDQRVQAP